MTCPSLERVAEYDAGLGTGRQRAAIAAHVESCARCREELATLRATVRAVEAMPAPAMPETMWAGVAARISAKPRRAWHWWWQTAAGFGVAASLAVGLIITRQPAPLQIAAPETASYAIGHELLSAQDPLADRAGLGVMLVSANE